MLISYFVKSKINEFQNFSKVSEILLGQNFNFQGIFWLFLKNIYPWDRDKVELNIRIVTCESNEACVPSTEVEKWPGVG